MGAAPLPMMPIRDVVVLPHMLVPFVVGRAASVRALAEALAGDKRLFLAAQRDASIDQPTPDEILKVGTIVNIVQSLKLPDGNIKVLVEGVERAEVASISAEDGFFRANVRTHRQMDPALQRAYGLESGPQLEELRNRVTSLCERYVKLHRYANSEQIMAAVRVDEPGRLADTVGANLPIAFEQKQELLEIFDPAERLARVAEILYGEIGKVTMMDDTLAMLRHTVATLAYRTSKATRGAPAEFAAYKSAPDSRTPAEILAHMGDLFDWALVMCDGRHEWHDSPALSWDAGMTRFFAALEAFDRRLSSGAPLGFPAEKIFQGPIADALTHVGQIAMLRRMAGSKMRGENYFAAKIEVGRVGKEQAAPVMEFE